MLFFNKNSLSFTYMATYRKYNKNVKKECLIFWMKIKIEIQQQLDVIVLSRTQLTSPTLSTIFHTHTDTHTADKHTLNTNINNFQSIFLLRPRSFSDLAYMSSVTSAV